VTGEKKGKRIKSRFAAGEAGVMECWKNGKLLKKMQNPSFHYSTIPVFQSPPFFS